MLKSKITGLLVLLSACATFVGCTQNQAEEHKNTFSGNPLVLTKVVPDLKITQPVALLQEPNDDSLWYVVEREGRVKSVSAADSSDTGIFIDISDRVFSEPSEAGLMSMAFHPKFKDTGYVYLSYTRKGNPVTSYVSRFTSRDNGKTLDPNSEFVILKLDNKYDKHNVTQLMFGPHGLLYIGFGDGHEGDNDPLGNGQNTQTIMGAILRINVDEGQPYSIPQDNPFADGKQGKPEIFAWGFRNPWRFSFDRQTGVLWSADVGQYNWEEIDQVKLGGNYGWPVREGSHCLGSRVKCFVRRICFWDCEPKGLINPVFDYSHADGCAIIGGYVYRGSIASLQGVYVYGDFCGGKIWGLFPSGDSLKRQQLLASQVQTVSFAEGNDGELYVIDYKGNVYKIEEKKS